MLWKLFNVQIIKEINLCENVERANNLGARIVLQLFIRLLQDLYKLLEFI